MLSVVPRAIQVKSTGGACKQRLVNTSITRLAFKIKVTNKAGYRFMPVYGFIEPQAACQIAIQRLPGDASEDVLIIQYAEVSPESRDPKAPFRADAQQGEIIVQIHAV